MPEIHRMKAKIALIGESAVGKTSLIRRFVKDEYDDKYLHTVGTKVTKLELTVPFGADIEVVVDLAIFDIMGQQGFKDLIKETFFFGCQGILAVCDVTRKETLAAVHVWMATATGVAGDVPAFLLVNKMDLAEHHRAFPDSEVERVAQTWDTPIAYTSARTGVGVDDAFNSLAISIVDEAFREVRARTAEEDLRRKILSLLARGGHVGIKKAEFFEALKGVSYTELERELAALERDGLIRINWMGPADFTVLVTPLGDRATRASL